MPNHSFNKIRDTGKNFLTDLTKTFSGAILLRVADNAPTRMLFALPIMSDKETAKTQIRLLKLNQLSRQDFASMSLRERSSKSFQPLVELDLDPISRLPECKPLLTAIGEVVGRKEPILWENLELC